MVESKSEVADRIVKIGQRFASHKACPGKDTLVKLLKVTLSSYSTLLYSINTPFPHLFTFPHFFTVNMENYLVPPIPFLPECHLLAFFLETILISQSFNLHKLVIYYNFVFHEWSHPMVLLRSYFGSNGLLQRCANLHS